MFGDISVVIKRIEIPKAYAEMLEKNRKLLIVGNYVHWDDSEIITLLIPDDVTTFEFDFKDESDSDSLPDEDGYISSFAPLDGRIYYQFKVLFSNPGNTRTEEIKVVPVNV